MVISGRRYVDGGVRSMTSLDVLGGTDVHDVYVLAPMASTHPDHPLQPHLRIERRLRHVLTRALVRQARALAARGKRVVVLMLGPRDLAAMGVNLMDARRLGGRARTVVLDLGRRAGPSWTATALAGGVTPAVRVSARARRRG